MDRSWQWGNGGVDLSGTSLLWYENLGAVSFAGGGALEQSLDDFALHGPPVDGVPADVLADLRGIRPPR